MFKAPKNHSKTAHPSSRKLKHRRRQFKAALIIVIAFISLLLAYFFKLGIEQLIQRANNITVQSTSSTPPGQTALSIKPSNSPRAANFNTVQLAINSSSELQQIVSRAKKHCQSKNLPIDALSISLLDLKTSNHAGYQNTVLVYPASVAKLFWLFYSYHNSSDRLGDNVFSSAIEKMIVKSDNSGASEVLDAITNTKSTDGNLSPTDFSGEREKRQQLNKFYSERGGYSPNINVSQKTFPIPQANIMEPKGFDQQLRGDNLQDPIRNKITTDDATLLMAEIIKNPSSEMAKLLTRNIDPKFWKKQPLNPIDFNPVHSFFGEDLEALGSENIVSKAGWTSVSRQEVAYIKSKDGKIEYILAVFSDSKGYAKDKRIFPEISNIVYREMRKVAVKPP
jgi:hypothetical protein